jgi:hypothetical protein
MKQMRGNGYSGQIGGKGRYCHVPKYQYVLLLSSAITARNLITFQPLVFFIILYICYHYKHHQGAISIAKSTTNAFYSLKSSFFLLLI